MASAASGQAFLAGSLSVPKAYRQAGGEVDQVGLQSQVDTVLGTVVVTGGVTALTAQEPPAAPINSSSFLTTRGIPRAVS